MQALNQLAENVTLANFIAGVLETRGWDWFALSDLRRRYPLVSENVLASAVRIVVRRGHFTGPDPAEWTQRGEAIYQHR